MAEKHDRTTVPVLISDPDLLRCFEPVARFTRGEKFFPTDINHYIIACSLWEHHPDGHDELLIPQGELTCEKLYESRPAEFGTVRFLRFIEPLSLAESAQVLTDQLLLRTKRRDSFMAGIGRLARGGFLPRMMDALFSISFLLRGRVSAATAAAAELDYDEMTKKDDRFIYYGRVARQNGWTILQYWFFYCFNNWRSGFHGVNDHESDWEMISIYLYEENGILIPEWVAYASHDFKGDDLRRRWDDHGELELMDGHPVVHIGAGSHASYFRRGEYQAEVNIPLPGWFMGILKTWNKLWVDILGQPAGNPFRIPFVDFARGDGLTIGPGQPRRWTAIPIDESTPWVSQYQGLWGLYARDPISGENAPAGPMYNRDGSPRSSWYDPLGFAGLDKVPPPPRSLSLLESNCQKIRQRQDELKKIIPGKAEELQEMGIRLKGMIGNPHLAKQFAALGKKISAISTDVRALRYEQSENAALLQGLNQRLKQEKIGRKDDAHAHIRHLAVPAKAGRAFRFNQAADAWAAISLSLLLFVIAAFIFFAPQFFWIGLATTCILFVLMESVLRGAFIQTVGKVTLLMAMIASAILFIHFWKWIIVTVLLALGIFLMVQRLRELTG